MNVDELFEVPVDFFELFGNVAAQRGCDFHVMTAEIDLHEIPPA
jgi:hypothetical protein